MLSAVLQLLLVIIALLVTAAVAARGFCADRSEIPSATTPPPLVVGGRKLYRVPARNTHRAHGRHRAA